VALMVKYVLKKEDRVFEKKSHLLLHGGQVVLRKKSRTITETFYTKHLGERLPLSTRV